jgi:hypothetical protein
MCTDEHSSRERALTMWAAGIIAIGMSAQVLAAVVIARQIINNPGVRHWGLTTWTLAFPSMLTGVLVTGWLVFRPRHGWAWACLLVSCAISIGIVHVDRTGVLIEYERWIRNGMP